jgi:DNA modification methylase
MAARTTRPGDPVEALISTDGGHPRIAVQYLQLDQLTLDPRNARAHSKRQIRQIARSIKAFGFLAPILIDRLRRILAGNGRFMAAKDLGLPEVPTISVDHLTAEQARAFAIADNRLTENSSWDKKVLAEHFKELAALDLTFSLDTTGFEMGEIDVMIEGLEIDSEDAAADEAPAVRPYQVSRLGDTWLCGPHRVHCGNALDLASYSTVMSGKLAQAICTDPPYNVPIAGHVSGLGKTKHREFPMATGEMSEADFMTFLRTVLTHGARVSADGSIIFVFMDWRHLYELLAAGHDLFELKNICVWTKHNAGMGSFYRSKHELVAVFKHGKAPHRNNVELGRHGRHRSNVWDYPGVTPFGMRTDEGKLLDLHPTVKPVRMLADALMDCTARGDVVLDPFLGSGSTLIAAERSGRVCHGIELDPGYVDTAVRRWQSWTGQQAVHAETGKPFDELDAAAEKAHGR